MTNAQWLFEFYSLQKKEETQIELFTDGLKALKHMLVSVLGLNLLKDDDDSEESFMPLSMLTGRREIVEAILAKFNKDKEVQAAIDDDQFEALSAALASESFGDMSPIIDIPKTDVEEAIRKEKEKELTSLGIKIVDEVSDMEHISVNVPEMKQKIDDAKSSKNIEKEIEKIVKKPVSIKFDDNVT